MNGREWFFTASEGFLAVLSAVTADSLDQPGLGEWDVRALVGHACRAYSTIETYVTSDPTGTVDLHGPVDYFRTAQASGLAAPTQVAERGRDAGRALGAYPVTAASELAERVVAFVRSTSGDVAAATPLGRMRLDDYLPTRAFELTVHGLDLARATDQAFPQPLLDALPPALGLCTAIANPDDQALILLALTGRQPLPANFCLV